MGTSKTPMLLFLLPLLAVMGCSLALDFDGLSGGETGDGGTDQDPNACVVNAHCDDNIDCTLDTCTNYRCYRVPDNSKCDYLEMCSREVGCVHTGKECLFNADCDDKIACTIGECANGKCRYTPDDSLCVDEENLCVSGRTCVAGSGCTSGKIKNCDQSSVGPCESFLCEPQTGECTTVMVSGADDDQDGFFDVSCGGNDCLDTNPSVHPAAGEICNLMDDDCDGLTDLKAIDGPVTIMQASELSAPDLATDGTGFALTWQRGKDGSAAVYAQVLGEGPCVGDTVCGDPDGAPASEIINLTPTGGPESAGIEPSIAFGGGEFAVAWTVLDAASDPRLVVFGIKRAEGSTGLDLWADSKQISSSNAKTITRANLATQHDGSGWVAVWAGGFEDGSTVLEFTDSKMISKDFSPFQVTLESGDIVESVSAAVLADGGAIVSYGLLGALSGGDVEIFETRLDPAGETWELRNGWPKLVSSANVSKSEPSRQPVVAVTGPESWITAFSDIRSSVDGDPESDSDIRAVRSDGVGGVVNLFSDTLFQQLEPGFVYRGGEYGLSYVQDVQSGFTLDFRMFDADLNRYGKQGGRFVYLKDGSVSSSRLVEYSSGFALSWVESPEAGDDTLKFASFEGCVQDTD